jgi:hypothetical protein
MSFSFGFSGDDVEVDDDVVVQNDNVPSNGIAESQFVGLPAEEHSLEDLVGFLIALQFLGLFTIPSGASEVLPIAMRIELDPSVIVRIQYPDRLPPRSNSPSRIVPTNMA